jgi:long-chain acyl-CoA synthetase
MADGLQTIPSMLARTVERCADEQALGFVRGGELNWRTWREVANASLRLAEAIRAAGIEPGDRVAHVSENRYDWVITDLAMHLAGVVHVPIHVTLSGEQIAAQIADSGAKLLFVASRALLGKFAEFVPANLQRIIHDEHECEPAVRPPAEPGANFPNDQFPGPDCELHSLATILYTSGTTGRPRGVMLSQRNLVSNAQGLVEAFGGDPEQTRLCILPLSHVYARTCDLYTWVVRGCRLVIGESRETIYRDCQLAQPTAISAVPFVYQRVRDKLCCGDAAAEAEKLRAFFGGRMQSLCSGGAPLAPDVATWYAERGMPILPGYGLTETSPVISVSTPSCYRFGAVGKLLPDVEVRIAEDGEILTRGPHVMQGYWRDEAGTAQILRDEWLSTGDLGELDGDGFLFIRGRKKELIALCTGKKVIPTRVESLLTASPLIEQAVVFGEGLPALVALIVPADGAGSEAIAAEVKRCLASAAHEEQVRQFTLLERPFSIERGEMTAKLSLCRTVIARNFAAELQAMQQLESSKFATQK